MYAAAHTIPLMHEITTVVPPSAQSKPLRRFGDDSEDDTVASLAVCGARRRRSEGCGTLPPAALLPCMTDINLHIDARMADVQSCALRAFCVLVGIPTYCNGVAIILGRGRGVAGSATGSERAQDPLLLAGVPGAPQTSSRPLDGSQV